MTDVAAHLRACAARFNERDRRPVVAWDCMGAATWAKVCNAIADEIESLGLAGEQAIGFLKAKAHQARTGADAKSQKGLGFLVSMDAWTKFDEIIDPIARDRRGWIEVSGHAEHFNRIGIDNIPTYRRMLGSNQCVATLTREWREERRPRYADHNAPRRCWVESDEAWEARRLEWLGRYHPDVWVVHKEGGWERDADFDFAKAERTATSHDPDAPRARQYTPLYGTVRQHMAESMPFALSCAFGTYQTMFRPEQRLAA